MSAPARTLRVKNGDKDVELVMSYAMLTELLRITQCDTFESATNLLTDLYCRDLAIRRLMTTELKRPVENYDELVSGFDLELTPEDEDAILSWVMGHVIDFFARSLKVMQTVKSQSEEKLKTA